jgi:hypothetical protein
LTFGKQQQLLFRFLLCRVGAFTLAVSLALFI